MTNNTFNGTKHIWINLVFVLFISSYFQLSAQTSLLNCSTVPNEIEILRFRDDLTYAQGSNITIFINPKGFYELDNQFELYLQNATNNSEILLSTKEEFYS